VESNEQNLLNLLAAGDKAAFETLFKGYFKSLHRYALGILQDEATAEEIVQQVFYKIWERKSRLKVHTSFRAFLYTAVYNECINYIKHKQHKTRYHSHVQYTHEQSTLSSGITDRMEANELAKRLLTAIAEFPEQCGLLFCLSRFEELKYREIADKLGISVKTVEAQVTKAMKILRKKL